VDPILLGVIAGVVFALLEVVLVLLGQWPGAREEFSVLVASAVNRFATGLFIPNVDLGMPLWVTGIVIGIVLALPIAAVGRRTVGPLGLGAVGGITIAAVAELTG
jgi:hypothetical protein